MSAIRRPARSAAAATLTDAAPRPTALPDPAVAAVALDGAAAPRESGQKLRSELPSEHLTLREEDEIRHIQARLADIGSLDRKVRRSLAAKRVFDVGVCVLLSPFLLPLLAVIAVAVLVDSGRPVIFVQQRVGRGGRAFRMYKFRTLWANYDQTGGRDYMRAFVRGEIGAQGPWANKPVQDVHMTRLGRLLRKTSLDELPQILNVLRGEMSLVGPRPNVVYEVTAYTDAHLRRLEALPGITGLAQVRGRSSITFEDIAQSDIEYIDRGGLGLDVRILWQTVMMVLRRHGAQ